MSNADKIQGFFKSATVVSEQMLDHAERLALADDGVIDAQEQAAVTSAWDAALAGGANPSTEVRNRYARLTGRPAGVSADAVSRVAPSTLGDSTIEAAVHRLMTMGWSEPSQVKREADGSVSLRLFRQGAGLWGAWEVDSYRFYSKDASLQMVIQQDGSIAFNQDGRATASTLEVLLQGVTPKPAVVDDLLPAGTYRIKANNWTTLEILTDVPSDGRSSFEGTLQIFPDGTYAFGAAHGAFSFDGGLQAVEVKRNPDSGRLELRCVTRHYTVVGDCPFDYTAPPPDSAPSAGGRVLGVSVTVGPMPRRVKAPDWKMPSAVRIGG